MAFGSQVSNDVDEAVAIIGFALKFPGDADSSASFWSMLEGGRSAMSEWPKDRLTMDAFYHRDSTAAERVFVPGAHFLKEDPSLFDAQFFGISATEAQAMDPQHRILLETTYHALENAGLPLQEVSGSRTGVYTGSMAADYQDIIRKDLDRMPTYTATGIAASMMANRLSWFFNFTGPSINMDSACSSSLTGLDFAVQGLQNKDSDMAVVGGGGMMLSAESTLSLMKMNMLSPDGKCFSFDERANGYSRGEGISVVIIKRLRDALRDGNAIRAIIRATGSNQDGHTPGVTQPNKDAQALLIKQTYQKAGLDLAPTRYCEAHGTGTALGDPIEANAIGAAFRRARAPSDPLYIGAVKSNIGHLEGGSGLAGLIKAILVLEKGMIPPNANFASLNRKIDAEFLNVKFPTQLIPWPVPGLRRASVNSFGFGGSNAHVILDDAFHFLHSRGLSANHYTRSAAEPDIVEINHVNSNGGPTHPAYPKVNDFKHSRAGINGEHLHHYNCQADSAEGSLEFKPKVFAFSAADENGIDRLVDVWEDYLAKRPASTSPEKVELLEGLSYNMACQRSALSWRSFVIADTTERLRQIKDLVSRPVRAEQGQKIAFVFNGQGTAYCQMGLPLLAYPTFRNSLESFDLELAKLDCPWSALDILQRDDSAHLMDDPTYSQPLTTAIQIAIFELLGDLNITPVKVVGHSSGEIAAAYAASGLSLRSACRVSYHRGRLAASLRQSGACPGAMLSVDLSEEDIMPHLENFKESLTIACFNNAQNVTVSGDETAIDLLIARLAAQDVTAQKLRAGAAYHSGQMQKIAHAYGECIKDLNGRKPDSRQGVTMYSTVTGSEIMKKDVLSTPEYWVKNLVHSVQYLRAVSLMVSDRVGTQKLGSSIHKPINDLLEVGPHPALQRPIRSILDGLNLKINVRYDYVLHRKRPGLETLLGLCGRLWSSGYPIALHKPNQTKTPFVSQGQLFADLPYYPFNHANSYWHETPLSKHSRIRNFPRYELLGTPVAEWNPLEPRWRKIFDSSETPWIEEHKVNGKPIYPATGMVIMAIEGAKQLADPGRTIHGFQVKDATFSHPIPVGSSDASEVHLFMRSLSSRKSSDGHEYRICTRIGDEWQENSRGEVQVEYARVDNDVTSFQSDDKNFPGLQQKYAEALKACSRSVETEKMYQRFRSDGLDYGKSFQTLDEMAWDGGGCSIGTIKPFEWTRQQSRHERQAHIVHPTTLDAAGQLMWVAMTKGATQKVFDGIAATRIRRAWISASGLSYPQTTKLRACSECCLNGLRGTDTSAIAVDDNGEVRIVIEHFETTAISGNNTTPDGGSPRQISYRIAWKPDVTLMSSEQALSYCKAMSPDVPVPSAFSLDLERVLYHFAEQALDCTRDVDRSNLMPHMQKYIAWLDTRVKESCSAQLGQSRDATPDSIHAQGMVSAIDRVQNANPEGKLFATVGRNLEAIIHAKANPLELMFGDGLVNDFYTDVCDKISSCRQMEVYIDLLAHKNSSMKVLEIGAGTGSVSRHVVKALCTENSASDGIARFGRYDYTDISESFFEQARERFQLFKPKMQFRMLNIEDDIIDQGYKEGEYDLIIAAWVLHATRDLSATVRNVRKLLKPGGKLVLVEITRPNRFRCGVAFGTLPGWWLSIEDFRQSGPCISHEDWRHVLKAEGFSGVDVFLPDYQDEEYHEHAVLIATAVEQTPFETHTAEVTCVVDDEYALQSGLISQLKSLGEPETSIDLDVISISDIETITWSKYSTTLFIPRVGKDEILCSLDEKLFGNLQRMISNVHDLVWVTSNQVNSPEYPLACMVNGFARVLCSERSDLSFTSLALESIADSGDWTQSLTKILNTRRPESGSVQELELAEQGEHVEVDRIVQSRNLDRKIHNVSRQTVTRKEIQECSPMTIMVANPGSLDSLQFVADPTHSMELGLEEVEIEVKAVGINFRDLMVMLGRYAANAIGLECSGIVTRIGSKCLKLQKGDRVCAATLGCLSTRARCNFRLAAKIPDDVTFPQAASLPITGITSHYSLRVLANLQRDDTVLIHSAAGGVGQTAIQIAQSIGSEIFATVSSKEKMELLMEVYHIPADHIFYSRDASFAKSLMQSTQNRGVDVVLNSLSGDALIASWECVAPFGRFIEIGKADIEANSKLPMSAFAKNVSFAALEMQSIIETRPDIIEKSLKVILEAYARGDLRLASPTLDYGVSDIETPLRLMQSGKNTGKMVLRLDPTESVPVVSEYEASYAFDPKASYLIAGGLGGLGRSAAQWMASRGARHLILLSRSGARTEAAQSLVTKLQAMNVQVAALQCDVASSESLSAAVSECSSSMPPIKGCLQATMVLRDAIFDNMSFEAWTASIRSKVDSSRNLHEALSTHLDFFIMLSSAAAIVGSPSQANYAAGNTYQAGLAQYRRSLGLKATCIYLGWMGDVGIVAETEKYTRGLEAAADKAIITEKEYWALLETYCDPNLECAHTAIPEDPIIGLITPAQFRARGMEPPSWTERPLFANLAQIGAPEDAVLRVTEGGPKVETNFAVAFAKAGSADEARTAAVEGLINRLSRAVSVPTSDIDPKRPLHVYGVDSLLAVELRNWFAKVWKADIGVFDITGQGSVADLGNMLAQKSELRNRVGVPDKSA